MRDWSCLDRYYSELLLDIYEQPDSDGHIEAARYVIDHWISMMVGVTSVLDVGCGQGFTQPMFERYKIEYTGVALGEDVRAAQEKGANVLPMDMNFLDFPDDSFDMVWSRHSLEHSPFALLTLMEFHRVSKVWLCLILPSPKHYGWDKPNHYGIMTKSLADTILRRAGWYPVWYEESEDELRWMCQKGNRFVNPEEVVETFEEKTDVDESAVH